MGVGSGGGGGGVKASGNRGRREGEESWVESWFHVDQISAIPFSQASRAGWKLSKLRKFEAVLRSSGYRPLWCVAITSREVARSRCSRNRVCFRERDAPVLEIVEGEELLLFGWCSPAASKTAAADATALKTNSQRRCRYSGITLGVLDLMLPGVVLNPNVLINRTFHLFSGV